MAKVTELSKADELDRMAAELEAKADELTEDSGSVAEQIDQPLKRLLEIARQRVPAR